MNGQRSHRGSIAVIAALVAIVSTGAAAPAQSPAGSALPGASAAPAPSQPATIDVNTATQEEIAAAFVAAGIPNAERWAQEVVEYRPYEPDPTWARLRSELGKYGIDPAVLETIISLLRV
jgi:hypothetical protein